MAEPDIDPRRGATADPTAVRREPLVLPFTLDNFVPTRHAVRAYATGTGLSDMRLYHVVVAVSELMSNAVQHGGGSGTLRMWADDRRLYCEVADQGPGIPGGQINGYHLPDPTEVRGRGIWLTRQICDRVDVQTGPSGTTVRVSCTLQEES
ncbi:MAG TPA: ATP-binding protein [Micromonosporaceae bacterium]|nr:ATP-binding protein [Micromonosporaceae bacterium]